MAALKDKNDFCQRPGSVAPREEAFMRRLQAKRHFSTASLFKLDHACMRKDETNVSLTAAFAQDAFWLVLRRTWRLDEV